jgi:hypothetical protein
MHGIALNILHFKQWRFVYLYSLWCGRTRASGEPDPVDDGLGRDGVIRPQPEAEVGDIGKVGRRVHVDCGPEVSVLRDLTRHIVVMRDDHAEVLWDRAAVGIGIGSTTAADRGLHLDHVSEVTAAITDPAKREQVARRGVEDHQPGTLVLLDVAVLSELRRHRERRGRGRLVDAVVTVTAR